MVTVKPSNAEVGPHEPRANVLRDHPDTDARRGLVSGFLEMRLVRLLMAGDLSDTARRRLIDLPPEAP